MDVSTIAGKGVDLFCAELGHQIGYLCNYKDYVAKLKQKIEDLNGTKQRIQVRINEAARKGEDIEVDVQRWMTSVSIITSDAEKFAEKKVAWFNLISRYHSGKEARKKTSSMLELQQKYSEFVTVSHAPPPIGIAANSSKNIDAYKSQKSSLKEIMDALEKEKVHIVGVCGIGGVGKTTLVIELGKRVKASKQFDEVVMVVVSQSKEIKEIQDNLACELGMDKLPNDESRRGKLWGRICKGNKVLVILDDLWSRIDLDQLGVPVQQNIKIVLTSRNKDVCDEMGAQEVISVNPMPEEEAFSLFKHVVWEAVETDQEKNPIARDVCKECKGLPIAILAVGRALRSKSKVEWEVAYRLLKENAPPSINLMLKEVFPKLVLSYNYVENEEAKLCFLICSMFPEDYDIPIESLALYGMGLKHFQAFGSSLQDARLEALIAVNTLKRSHLLLPGKDHDHVKMHDVVRDVAITIASQDENNMFLVNAGMGLTMLPHKDSFEKYIGISLMENRISMLSIGLECPKLHMLLLQSNESLRTIPNEFFQQMTNLEVLDLHRCGISSIPSSLSSLTTLRSLYLDVSYVQDISSLEALTELQVLSLSSTRIDRIPEQIRCLTNLRLLDVRGCGYLSCIAPGVISNLQKLEDLYIGDGFMEWDMEGEANEIKNASLTELDSLYRLTNLDIIIPDMKMLPQNLQLKSLQRFNIIIGDTETSFADWDRWERYPDCCFLRLTLDMEMPLLGWVKKLMKAAKVLTLELISNLTAEVLTLESISNLNSIIPDVDEDDFNKVRFLEVSQCNDVSCLVDMAGMASTPVFCSLEELNLTELQNFTQICQAQLHPTGGSFSKLKSIEIWGCNKMSTALGSNLLSSLPNLTKLKVSLCSSMENIIESWLGSCTESAVEELEIPEIIHSGRAGSSCLQNLKEIFVRECEKVEAIIGAETNRDVTKVAGGIEKMTMFPSLEYIDLSFLPGLKSFCSECYNMVEYPSLSRVNIVRCENIEAWGNGIQLTPSLKENNIYSDNRSCKMVLKEGVNGTELEISNERLHLPLVSDST